MAQTGSDAGSENPLQGYFEWQVTTLLLAYDLSDPVARGDAEAAERRRRRVEEEVSALSLGVIPKQYQQDPELNWPPEVMMSITKATLLRTFEISGAVLEGELEG
ncbi:hypothetical protein [Mucisphaera sp.]|uniref:hypothetical protein n=1 Tax=Mucisphaera sp. TaxID=2913024 RepID=UPI003D0ECC9B